MQISRHLTNCWEDNPMSIDSHFYYWLREGANPLALSSQRTIDRLADGLDGL